MPARDKSSGRSRKAAGKKRKAAAVASSKKDASKKPKRPSKVTGAAREKKIGQMKQELFERLEALKGGMEHSLDSYSSAPKGARGDVSDLAADSLDGDTALQLAEGGSNEIAQIGEALGKIDDGTYGRCEICGEDIPWSRLEAVPYATKCIECKRRQEITGGSGGNAPGGWSAVDEFSDFNE